MGCDIHGYAELIHNGKWVCASLFGIDLFCDEDCGSKLRLIDVTGERDYQSFAQLCGVRDITGRCTPISYPRGLPLDISDEIKHEADSWGSDGHSHSYVSLKEIIDYRNNLPLLPQTGLISQEQIIDLHNGITPMYWCQGTTESGFERCDWTEKYDGLEKIELELIRLADFMMFRGYAKKNPENVRFVFWFDN